MNLGPTVLPRSQVRHPLRCSCCGHEVLAELVGDQLVILAKRHGKVHVLTLDLESEILHSRFSSTFQDLSD
jgi:hypothetical protein